jgi:hypothetical protein
MPSSGSDEAAARGAMPGVMGPGGAGGAGGRAGAAIGGGGSGKAPSFTNAREGAQSFLDALKSKDPELLREATALRSPTEAESQAHRDLFAAIQGSSLADSQLSELAQTFDGMSYYDFNVVKSTGRVGIILSKMKDRTRQTRTLFVRLEKAGWKVVDFGPLREFKPPVMGRRPTGKR